MMCQEIDVLFGCIHSDSDQDWSLYPSRIILEEGSFLWTGEWDSWMDVMFKELTKEILQGSAKFGTLGMWNEYFPCLNWGHRGSREHLKCSNCPYNTQDVLAVSAPNYLQRESEQKNNAGNALGQNVRTVGQRDSAKTHVMTTTE
jgi:hypothetical protein